MCLHLLSCGLKNPLIIMEYGISLKTRHLHCLSSRARRSLVLCVVSASKFQLISKMERRVIRVSEAQWNILLEFLEANPNLARGYNNTARGRAEASRLWQRVADQLNSEGSGTSKTPKEWSVYVSNYKSKLKKIVADIRYDATSTGGGPSRGNTLSAIEERFLAIMGPGFGMGAPGVQVNPFPEEPPTSPILVLPERSDRPQSAESMEEEVHLDPELLGTENVVEMEVPMHAEVSIPQPPFPRQPRNKRLRARPLAPLEESNRILSKVEMQRIAAEAAQAEGLKLISESLGKIAEAITQQTEVFSANIRDSIAVLALKQTK